MSDEAGYHEPARSYRSMWITAVLLALGFGLDLALGGGMAHLVGWLGAAALVLGAHFLVLYAVRSEKSLHVEPGELRVGDEALARSDIVALAGGVDDEELPVLGWPNGRPPRLTGVTVRLADGRDVIVPTRFPDRVASLLGPTQDGLPVRGQDVRAAGRADLPELEEIDRRAEAVFRAAGYTLPELPFPDPRRAKAVFVAGRPPIGFVQVGEVDGLAHVVELAVLPKWMRQGIGTRLLERACEWARRHDYPAVVLTTFADVPWNGPFYAAAGFVEWDDPGPGIAQIRANEQDAGLDAVGRRIVMRRELG